MSGLKEIYLWILIFEKLSKDSVLGEHVFLDYLNVCFWFLQQGYLVQ